MYNFLTIILLLAGCGFQPLHQESGQGHPSFAMVKIQTIEGQRGQYLRNVLLQRKGAFASQPQRYTLEIKLDEVSHDLIHEASGTVSRVEFGYTAHCTLTSSAKPDKKHTFIFKADMPRSMTANMPHLYHLSRDPRHILDFLATRIETQCIQYLNKDGA